MTHSLVTGGAGFIGSHLTEMLLARGDRVTVVDDESTGNRENLSAVLDHDNLTYLRDTVTDPEVVRRVTADVDEVYHMAAAVGVALIADAPIRSIETNIVPIHLILEELSRRKADGADVKIFIASSSEVYGKNPKDRWREDDDLVIGPTVRSRWSYGTAKAIDEFLALAHWRERQLPVVVGRFFNVIGPRQIGTYGMVLPRFVEAAVTGQPLQVHDDGQQERCFAHVADVCRAVLDLMSAPKACGQVFNIGSDQPTRILDLAEQVIAAVDRDPPSPIEFLSYADAYDADFEDCRRRVPDLSRLRETIAFSPHYDLPKIIAEVVASKRR